MKMLTFRRLPVAPFLIALAFAGAVTPSLAAQPTVAANTSASEKAYEAAVAKVKTGDYAGALKIVEPFRKEPSTSGHTLSLLGVLYLETGHPADALAVLSPLAASDHADAAVLYNAGRAASAAGDPLKATSYFQRAIKASKTVSPASRELGMLYASEGRAEEAFGLLFDWAEAHPDEIEPRTMAALMALRVGHPEVADKLINGLSMNNPGVRLLGAGIAVAVGDGQGAIELLAPLVVNHPAAMEVDIHKTQAEAYLRMGDPKSALAVLTPKAAITPTLTLLRATAQRQTGDAVGALATLKPLADKLPDDSRGLPDPRLASGVAVEYARSLTATGAVPAALPYFEKATRINPLSWPAWLALADAYDHAGRSNDAVAARAKADGLHPKTPPPAAAK
ncbi:MAG: tetratricopeptide repeat protein [Acidobacteriota bacterium]